MTRVRLLAALLLVLPLSSSAALGARGQASSTRSSPTVFAISGRGWGHGIGMSQWGAYGFAQHGTEYERILAHYYRGTTLGRAPLTRVRVLLVDGKRSLSISSRAALRVRDGLGETYELEQRKLVLAPALKLDVDGTGARSLAGPLTFLATTAPLELDGKRYRGSLQVAVSGGRLRAINDVGLDAYLYGVVPDEMPHTWPAEALKAQAVVARSYALAVRKRGAPFDVFDDVRSQVYGGIAAEERPATAAVNATTGQVLLHGGRVATTYFFSSSGGRTANFHDEWGGPPVPYLVSVSDPYDSASPHHSWGPFAYTPARLGRALGMKGTLLDVRTRVNGSGRVAQLTGIGRDGEASVRGAAARFKLGLRSTWFRVGVLRLDVPARPVTYGSRAVLSGIARGLPAVVLEQRAATGSWTRTGAVTPTAEGTFTVPVAPSLPLEYRLASGAVRTAAMRVAVAASVRLQAKDAGALTGAVRPALAGARVAVERESGGGWTTVATATVDERGTFVTRLALVPGSYRARVGAARGFAAGISPVLAVKPA